jgi:hypothetical protein
MTGLACLPFILGSKEFNCAQEEDEQAGTSLIFHNSEDFLTFLEKKNVWRKVFARFGKEILS